MNQVWYGTVKMHAMSEQKSFKFKYFLMLNIYKQLFSLCFRAKCSPPTQPAGEPVQQIIIVY